MSDAQSIAALSEILELTNRIAKKRDESQFDLFNPYPKQAAFLGCKARSKVMLGGNRCLGGEQFIYDPVDGNHRRIDSIKTTFHLETWDGRSRITTEVERPFIKSFGRLYEYWFTDGSHLICTEDHMIMGETVGWCRIEDARVGGYTIKGHDGYNTLVRQRIKRGFGFIWDIHVPLFNTYFVTPDSGVLSHNSGKTHTGTYEVTCHLTGLYPKWWEGIRFGFAPTIWVAGESVSRVRDTIQAKLFGGIGRQGTGMVPKGLVLWDDIVKKPGTPHALDIVPIKHVSGGIATVQFFSYDQGMDKFMGSPINLGWADEEPPMDINNELKMRILDTDGHLIYTFTPLSGVTPLYNDFMQNDAIPKFFLSWDDVTHLSEEGKEELIMGMSEAEIQARKYGIAVTGTGKVFQFDESEYLCDDFEVPKHYPHLGGLDIGLTHPTAACKLRYDEEGDIIYITNEYRVVGKTPLEHAHHLKPWKCRFSLSKDAWNANNQTKNTTAKVYTDAGLEVFMCDMAKGSVDASIHEIRARVASGRFYIFRSCHMAIDEFRTYRSNDRGVIVKVGDDLIAAIRYAIMKLDKAEVPGRGKAQMELVIPTYKPATRYEGC